MGIGKDFVDRHVLAQGHSSDDGRIWAKKKESSVNAWVHGRLVRLLCARWEPISGTAIAIRQDYLLFAFGDLQQWQAEYWLGLCGIRPVPW